MTTAEALARLGPAQPNANGIIGACRNHPDRPGTYAWADGTFRCDPCHQEPRVIEWAHAGLDSTCRCGTAIRALDRVAVLDTSPPSTCCEQCVDHD